MGGAGEKGQYYLEKHMNKIDYEWISTCARIEIGQDADNAGQKVQ